jgi:hypothetical protein
MSLLTSGVSRLSSLVSLALADTNVSDAGLVHLKGLANLSELISSRYGVSGKWPEKAKQGSPVSRADRMMTPSKAPKGKTDGNFGGG